VEVVASLSQGRTAAAQCGLFTYKSVPVIFEPSCISGRKLLDPTRYVVCIPCERCTLPCFVVKRSFVQTVRTDASELIYISQPLNLCLNFF